MHRGSVYIAPHQHDSSLFPQSAILNRELD